MSAKKRLVRKNRRQRRGERLAKRLSIGKGSAVALALGLGLAAGAPAEAAIVYSGPLNQTTIPSMALNFLTYPSSPYQFNLLQYPAGGYEWGFLRGNHAKTYAVSSYSFIFPWVDKLGSGATIDSYSNWANVSAKALLGVTPPPYGYFIGQRGYAGLSFDPDGNGLHYGWADLKMPGDGSSITLYGWAYESEVGKEIQAGAVPLPSSLLLLASGAFGLLGYRRVTRKK